MSDRYVVLFECAPEANPAWVRRVCEALKLTLVDNDQVAASMPEEARPLLLEQGVHGEDPRLGPHYARALAKVAGGATRLALQSTSWLLYGERPAAVVLDPGPALAQADNAVGQEPGGAAAARDYLEEVRRLWRSRIEQHLASDRVLELPVGIPEEKKAALASAHLSRWDQA